MRIFFRIKNAANYFPKWNFLSKPLKHTSSFVRSWPCTKTEIETSYYSFTDVYLPFSKILISTNGICKQRNRWRKKRSTYFWPCTSCPTRTYMQWAIQVSIHGLVTHHILHALECIFHIEDVWWWCCSWLNWKRVWWFFVGSKKPAKIMALSKCRKWRWFSD